MVNNPSTSLFPISKNATLYVVMIVDGWFPSVNNKRGVWGGRQVHVRQLRRSLLKTNCKVELFYPKSSHPLFKLWWFLYVIPDILLYSRYRKVQVIHAHGELAALAGKIIGLLRRLPVIVTVHNTSHMDTLTHSLTAWWQAITFTKIAYDAQISVSSHFTKYPNVNQAITIIPNGINLTPYNRVIVNKFPQPTLIWVGKKEWSKGVDVLKKAIVKVRKVFPTLKTEFVTGGRLSGKSLIRAYKRAHIFVLPSLADAQPISLLEAWAAKLPVVVTAVGENQTMVKHGHNGLLVEPGNVRQLSLAIIKVLRSRTLAPKLAHNGFITVKNLYTWSQVAKRTRAVYLQAIARRSEPVYTKSKVPLTHHAR
jgi:glycosyltransferase involved in cell wall biosynthesis